MEYRIFWGNLKVCTHNYRPKKKNRGVHFDLGSREIRFWTPLIAGTIHNPLKAEISDGAGSELSVRYRKGEYICLKTYELNIAFSLDIILGFKH